MDFLPFDLSRTILGIIGVLGVCAVIYLGRFVLTKLEMNP